MGKYQFDPNQTDLFRQQELISDTAPQRREYQTRTTATAIKELQSGGNTLVILPTGMGKTYIAQWVANQKLKLDEKKPVLFFAPTNILVEQHAKDCRRIFNFPYEKVKGIGGMSAIKRKDAYESDARVIVSTPEAVQKDIEAKRLDAADFSLIIMDEAHHAIGDNAEAKVGRAARDRGIPIVAFTALIRKGDIQKVAENLGITNLVFKSRGDPDVKPYLKKIIRDEIYLDLPPHFIEASDALKLRREIARERLAGMGFAISSFRDSELKRLHKELVDYEGKDVGCRIGETEAITYENAKKAFKAIGTMPPENTLWDYVSNRCGGLWAFYARNGRKYKAERKGMGLKFSDISKYEGLMQWSKLQHLTCIINLLETASYRAAMEYFVKHYEENEKLGDRKKSRSMAELGSGRHDNVPGILGTLSRKKDHPAIGKLVEIINDHFATAGKGDRKVLVFAEPVSQARIICSLLSKYAGMKAGILTGREGGMSKKGQKEAVDKFAMGGTEVLVGTRVMEEGLHIPSVKLAVVYSQMPSGTRKAQSSGRVGRDSAGRVVYLLTKNTVAIPFYHAGRNQERESEVYLAKIARILKEAVAENKRLEIPNVLKLADEKMPKKFKAPKRREPDMQLSFYPGLYKRKI